MLAREEGDIVSRGGATSALRSSAGGEETTPLGHGGEMRAIRGQGPQDEPLASNQFCGEDLGALKIWGLYIVVELDFLHELPYLTIMDQVEALLELLGYFL